MPDAGPRSRGRRLLRAVAAASASVLPVGLLAYAVRQRFDPVIRRDEAAILAATGFTRRHRLTPVLVVLQRATLPAVVHAASALALVRMARRTGLEGRAVWAFATGMTGWAVGAVTKLVVRRVRPVVEDPLAHSSGYSFPSAHALNAAAAGSALLVVGWPRLSGPGRGAAVTGVAVGGLAVGLDRVLLGAHFPSDVVAGWLLGLGVTLVSRLGYTRWTPPARPGRPLAPASLGWPA